MQTDSYHDKYTSVYYAFGPEKTLALAFCELLTANLLAVLSSTTPGEPSYRYQFKGELPALMLHRVEQIVAEELWHYVSYRDMVDRAVQKVQELYRVRGSNSVDPVTRAALTDPFATNQQFTNILAEALNVNALAYHIEPPGC